MKFGNKDKAKKEILINVEKVINNWFEKRKHRADIDGYINIDIIEDKVSLINEIKKLGGKYDTD